MMLATESSEGAEMDENVRYSTVGVAGGLDEETADNGGRSSTRGRRYHYCSPVVRWLVVVNVALVAVVIYLLVTTTDRSSLPAPLNKLFQSNHNPHQQQRINWTPLPSSDTILTKIAFGSCANQRIPTQPHWDAMSAYDPDLILLMGDNVYGDCTTNECAELKQAYVDWSKHPSLVGAAERYPIMATLDDHDYGEGDCHADNPHKDLAKQLFVDFFQLQQRQLPDDGVYQSRFFRAAPNRLQILVLDTRYNRSPFVSTRHPNAPYRPYDANETMQYTMLGDRQWAWLQEQLEQPADLRILVSSIQVLNDVVEFEGWRHLPAELERLYELIADKNVLIVSGDRHVGGFYQYDYEHVHDESDKDSNSSGASTHTTTLREVTASSFTHTIPLGAFTDCTTPVECDEPAGETRIGDLIRENHFGAIDIDWDGRRVVATLRRAQVNDGFHFRNNHPHTLSPDVLQSIDSVF